MGDNVSVHCTQYVVLQPREVAVQSRWPVKYHNDYNMNCSIACMYFDHPVLHLKITGNNWESEVIEDIIKYVLAAIDLVATSCMH